jgi:hypothetical protein
VPGSFTEQSDDQVRPFWSVSAFQAAIRQYSPDFQRSAGDYDAWYIRERESGTYLRGFEHWEDVEGALISFMLGGPLYWLGVTELGFPKERDAGQPVMLTAFRFSEWASVLLNFQYPVGLMEESASFTVRSNGQIIAPLNVQRAARYQVARFCEWREFSHDAYHFFVSPGSLNAARKQGLNTQQLLYLLKRYTGHLPPKFFQALERWEASGSEVKLQNATLLRVKDPNLIEALRKSKAARFLGEALSPTAILVMAGREERIISVIAEMGYLTEMEFEMEGNLKKSPE